MAKTKKRRGGLGRGLDALIPDMSEEEKENEEITDESGETTSFVSDQENHKEWQNEAMAHGRMKMVRMTQIEPNQNQPRKNFDEEKLNELAQSIQENGLLEPILVQIKGDHYEIVAGERRWRACHIAGLKEIPVIIKEYSDQDQVEISLIENIQREDLNPIEEAKAYQKLSDEFHLSQEEIAKKVSKDRASVANTMRLLKLAETVQEMVANGELSMGQARALITVEDKELQIELAKRIVEEKLSVREVEKLIRSLTNEKTEKTKKQIQDPASSAIYRDIENQMKSSLGMKVELKPKGKNGGKLEITFSSEEELEKLMECLIGSSVTSI